MLGDDGLVRTFGETLRDLGICNERHSCTVRHLRFSHSTTVTEVDRAVDARATKSASKRQSPRTALALTGRARKLINRARRRRAQVLAMRYLPAGRRLVARLLSSPAGRPGGRDLPERVRAANRSPDADGYVHFGRRFGGTANNGSRRYLFAGLAGGAIGVYYVAHLERAPETGRIRMIDMSRRREQQLGISTFNQLLSSHKNEIVPKTHPQSQRVERLGQRIASAARLRFPGQVDHFEWEFALIDAPGIANACCCPGGKVVVYSGILQVARDDDALAAIMAHEIAHAVARHSAERMSFSMIVTVMTILAEIVFQTGGLAKKSSLLLVDLPYSRALEREADHIGLMLMAQACYDPHASPRMFKQLEKASDGAGKTSPLSTFLSTHPPTENRVALLNERMPEAERQFNSTCKANFDEFERAYGATGGFF